MNLPFLKSRSLNQVTILIALIGFIATSCAKYQYVALTGDLDRAGRFVYENDSLTVTYRFSGQSGPVNIEVFNKQKEAIYVDWKKSAFIVDGNRTPYWHDDASFSSISDGSTINWINGTSTTRTFSEGSLVRGEQISFVPPRSFVRVSPLKLSSSFLNTGAGEKRKVKLNAEGGQAVVSSFTKENSPLVFRSFLTLSTNERFDKPITLDHEFWISEIMETLSGPRVAARNGEGHFYNESATKFGAVVLCSFAIVSLVSFLVIGAGY